MNKIFKLILLLLITNFAFITNTYADDNVTQYCEYTIGESSNLIGNGNDYKGASFYVYDTNGTLNISFKSNNDKVQIIKGSLDKDDFYSNGKFSSCPKVLYGKTTKSGEKATFSINSSKSLFGTTYFDSTTSSPKNMDLDDLDGGLSTCDGLLGDLKPDLENILKIMRIIGPALVVALSTWDYLSAIFSKDAELLKKANDKLTKRLILVVLLFFLPILLNLILGFVDASYTTCIS